MIKTAVLTTALLTVTIFGAVDDFHKALPTPVEISQGKEDPRLTEVRQVLRLLGRDDKFALPIYRSALAKNLNPTLWCCTIESESEFKITAKSPKGYKGLGQTPKAVMKTGYEEADLLYAACVLDEKIKAAHGDVRKGLALYKGGNNPLARKQANAVFTLYHKVKSELKET